MSKNTPGRKPRRARKAALITAAIALLCAASAVAFYLAFAGGSGESSSTLGEASAPQEIKLQANFAPGLSPGQQTELHLMADNPATTAGQIKTMQIEARSKTPGCEASWFKIQPESAQARELLEGGLKVPVSVAPSGSNYTPTGIENVALKFLDSGTNQNACSGGDITIIMRSQP
jgi:hypothetical protein